ncbi:hypothetical protein M0R45_025909 [Rubus argutus]|uniref:Uncharacterized protein n=1 Tax=Rubus argutus TaxID=59490 RepID=A0AAW1WXF1_RUBAR
MRRPAWGWQRERRRVEVDGDIPGCRWWKRCLHGRGGSERRRYCCSGEEESTELLWGDWVAHGLDSVLIWCSWVWDGGDFGFVIGAARSRVCG